MVSSVFRVASAVPLRAVGDYIGLMAEREPAVPTVRTKLHRPPVPSDVVCRKALHDRLDEGGHKPLTLVSAPAGYGKSTLVAHWLETREGRSAWLSLDEVDDDLRTFLGYVVAALKSVFPQACAETQGQLEAEGLPMLPVLAGCLDNDLEDLDESLVLVLDDYHRIEGPNVHELLNHLLKHPPAPLQLVIVSRYDPPLLLGALRAHNDVTEIRMRDLVFTPSETATFLEQAIGRTVSSAALACLHQSIEGWVVGLRLVALALRHHSDADAFLREFNGDARTVREYLVEEVLSQQLPATVEWLCRTSILERFCAPLCEVVGTAPGDGDGNSLDGLAFIQLLEDGGLFCVPLDERGEWYRYHHLFQELLHRQLKARLGPEEIGGLHRRAAAWFEAHGLLEEAIDHASQADGPAEAGRLMVRHRNDILNLEQWHRLGQWLNRLPAEVVEGAPELLMLKAWYFHNRGRSPEAFITLDRIQELIGNGPCDPGTAERLRGSIDALRSHQSYMAGQGDLAIIHAEQALMRLPPDCQSERAYALVIMGGALQMCGELEEARKRIYAELADDSIPTGIYQARMLVTLCFVNWIAADLPALLLAAKQYLELGEALGLAESTAVGRYFCGIAQYQQNELSDAEANLVPLVAERRVPNLKYFAEGIFALASVYQARGQADKAGETVEAFCEHLLRVRNTTLLPRAQAYRADLALRQGHMTEALNWAQQFNPEPFQNMIRFYEPSLTLAKVLIAEGSAQSQDRAASLLMRLEAFLAQVHNTRFLIDVLALQALLHDAQGDEPAAREVLGRAVALAQPGGFIRLFVDLGPGLARLLKGLELDAEGLRYVGRILAAYRGEGQTQAGAALDQSLTKREIEILDLLANELSNKQIADRLCISPATVKRHTENVYHKLGVPDRRKAVAKAVSLAIINSR